MVKVNVQIDCGNAPKKEFIRDFEIALARRDSEAALERLDDAIHWELVGDRTIEGKAAAEKLLETMAEQEVEELTLENVLTHGKVGAANGTIRFSNGDVLGFCDVVTFTSSAKHARIKKLSSYIVAL